MLNYASNFFKKCIQSLKNQKRLSDETLKIKMQTNEVVFLVDYS